MSRTQGKIFGLLLLGMVVLAALAFVSARTRRSRFAVAEGVSDTRRIGESSTSSAMVDGPDRPDGPARVSAKTSTAEGRQGQPDQQRIEGEIIGITAHGFEPAAITRHGRLLLVVENRSRLAEVTLRLERERGSRLREVRVRRENQHWSDDLDLGPGRYVLTEATHPDWICQITITP